MATTYILRCADNKLYVGSTTNIDERLKRHNAGYASEYTHLHRPVELVYKEEYDTYQEAFRRERQLKKWTLAKKEALIAGDIEKLKELSKSKASSGASGTSTVIVYWCSTARNSAMAISAFSMFPAWAA